MRVPKRLIGDWAKEIIDECCVSRDNRREYYRMWKNYYLSGTETGEQARYNRCYGHVDRLASYLFSPSDIRFNIDFDVSEQPGEQAKGRAAARYLNREFTRTGVHLTFKQGVDWALVKGCTILKMIWGHHGLEPWLVHPEFFGVLREDIGELDRQEAFVHTTYLTKSAFERTLIEHPERAAILKELESKQRSGETAYDSLEDTYFYQIAVGGSSGTTPVNATATGTGAVTLAPHMPTIAAEIAKDMVKIDELWVVDDERQDWTTIRLVEDDIVVEGRYKHENIFNGKGGEFLDGEHGFVKICPNEVDGFFWGSSEITQVAPLQDMLSGQIRDRNRLLKLNADPPRSAIGFSGLTQEKYRAIRRPGGFISEDTPNAKLESQAPPIPPELFHAEEKTIQYFDDVAGFAPITMGQGEQGVRAGVHAQTLARNAAPRMRDRALLVEDQAVDAGEICFKMLQNKDAKVYIAEQDDKPIHFLLSQLPDEYRITVDSHTSSPAFQEDNERKAFLLSKSGAIDHADLIMLTHPPHEDTLIHRAHLREKAQQKLIQEHPELLTKGRHPKK